MTSTSSLFQPSMEIPAGEDLEMASPYHGQVDDFDIDIDLMEDHASNMDSDMMGADDFPNNSQPSLFQNDATDDADMVDEPSEGSMVDVENLVDEDQDIDVQYDDVTYEAEMLEDEEPVEAPVPAIHIEPTTISEPQVTEPKNPVPETATEANQEAQADEMPPVPSTLEKNEPDTSNVEQPSVVDDTPAEPSKTEQPEADQSAPVGADHSQNPVEGQQTNETQKTDENAADEPEASEPPVETLEETQVSVQKDAENTEQQEMHAAHDTNDQNLHEEPLHPIKVMYQESEISLFPPWEGDSAETFFLHDEDVTYEHVDKLFSSLREVLEDNLAEHDVLVIDIDSLGIQITEDSSCTSKITLQQILNVYLRLCHNDGNHEPDALYLSLSSKPAVHSELASLDSAAKEGKGLSQVHLWGDYDETEQNAEETNDQPGEESWHGENAQQGQEIHEQSLPNDEVTSHLDESNVEGNVAAEATQEVDGSEQDIESHSNAHANAHEQEDAQAEAIGDHGDLADQKEATEAPVTEPISTPAPNTESAGTVQPENASTDVTQGDENDYAANKDVQEHDLEDFDDDFSDAHDLEVADLAVPEEYGDQDYDDDAHPEDDPSHDELAGADPEPTEQTEAAEQDAPAQTQAPNATDADFEPDVYEESESTVENAPVDDHSHEQNQDVEDDLLEISEDVFEAPSVDNQHKETRDSGDVFEDNSEDNAAAPPYEDDYDYNFDDHELDVTEGTELGELDAPATDSHANDSLSTKRSREEEDEWDITEATTPELKRQRSS